VGHLFHFSYFVAGVAERALQLQMHKERVDDVELLRIIVPLNKVLPHEFAQAVRYRLV